MKKIVMLILLFTVTIVNAQKNKKALEQADKMSKIMELNKDQKAKVLELILDKNKKKAILKKEHKGNKETYKLEAKKVEKEYRKSLKLLVGKDKMKLLAADKKAKKALKTVKN
jgi:hypothetical protein